MPFVTASRGVKRDDHLDEVRLDLQLSVPLDNFHAERARARQNRLLLMEQTIELHSIRNELERQLRQRHRRINQLDTTVRLAKIRVREERAKLQAFLQIYEREAANDLEVTRAKEAVDQAEVDLLDAQISRIVEEARYRAILPSLPTVPLDTPPRQAEEP